MFVLEKTLIKLEELYAKLRVRLLPEPDGDREGIFEGNRPTIELYAMGDSMVAACGTDSPQHGLVAMIAENIAHATGRQVHWRCNGKLGATMRRVRFRMIEQAKSDLPSPADLLFVIAGSNDIFARRTLNEWREDLGSVLEASKSLGRHTIVCSSGQMQHIPLFGKTLQHDIDCRLAAQSAASQEVCQAHGAVFVDLIHESLGADKPEFWASDHFHPGPIGYKRVADAGILMLLPALRDWGMAEKV